MPSRGEIDLGIGAQPLRCGSLVDHRARVAPHLLRSARGLELALQLRRLRGERVRVAAVRDEQRVALEKTVVGAQEIVRQRQGRERRSEIVGELGICRMTLTTGQPTPTLEHFGRRGTTSREGPGHQDRFRGFCRPHWHEEVVKAGVLGEQDLLFAANTFYRAVVVGVPLGAEAVRVLERHDDVGRRVHRVPPGLIAQGCSDTQRLKCARNLLRQERLTIRQAARSGRLCALVSRRSKNLGFRHRFGSSMYTTKSG